MKPDHDSVGGTRPLSRDSGNAHAFSRRTFLGMAAASLLPLSAAPRAVAGYASRQELRELRRGVGIHTGEGGTIGWLANGDGSLVVDSQSPASASLFLDALRRHRAATEIAALINTHHHADHTGGNSVIGPAALRHVAHRAVPDLQRRDAAARGAAEPTVASTLFDREWTLDIGSERVVARWYGPAHTAADCTVQFEQAGVVHVGDLVFNRAWPFVHAEAGGTVAGWAGVLDRILDDHDSDTIYIFGHAAPSVAVTGTAGDVALQRDLLTAVMEHVSRAVAQGRSREETTAVATLPGFAEHRALVDWLTLALTVGVAWDEAMRPGSGS
jgi:cyclase